MRSAGIPKGDLRAHPRIRPRVAEDIGGRMMVGFVVFSDTSASVPDTQIQVFQLAEGDQLVGGLGDFK
jgi:hypothetical protein